MRLLALLRPRPRKPARAAVQPTVCEEDETTTTESERESERASAGAARGSRLAARGGCAGGSAVRLLSVLTNSTCYRNREERRHTEELAAMFELLRARVEAHEMVLMRELRHIRLLGDGTFAKVTLCELGAPSAVVKFAVKEMKLT